MRIAMLAGFMLASLAQANPKISLNITYQANQLVVEQAIENWPSSPLGTSEFTLNSAYQILEMNPKPKEIEIIDGEKQLLRFKSGSTYRIKYKIPVRFQKNTQVSFYQEQTWYLQPAQDIKAVYSLNFQNASGDTNLHLVHSANPTPQDGISALLGHFKKYERPTQNGAQLQIYLIQPDEGFAKLLLDYLSKYMVTYESLIGDYPYDRFSVVENEDPTGYAFPTMTWIGSQILRFPFILTTSLPHELLHSWWGNGVFVDTSFGNWCEGLTTYLADYYFQPSEAAKSDYRLKQLVEYENYTKSGQEISLAEFRSRGEDRSLQAIGYGKSMFVFLMLEQQIGSENFKQLLRSLYLRFRGREASFRDIFHLASEISEQNLDAFFQYWVLQKGSLDLSFSHHTAKALVSTFAIESKLIPAVDAVNGQQIPLRVQDKLSETWLSLLTPIQSQMLVTSVRNDPKTVWYDPDFRLFRKLKSEEKPSVVSEVLASDQIRIASFSQREVVKNAYGELLRLESKKFTPKDPSQIDFEENGPMILLGSFSDFLAPHAGPHNQLVPFLEARGIRLRPQNKIEIAGNTYSTEANAFFLSVKYRKSSVLLILLSDESNGARIVQRMTRYGAQSFVLLSPSAALAQGLWQGLDSELKVYF